MNELLSFLLFLRKKAMGQASCTPVLESYNIALPTSKHNILLHVLLQQSRIPPPRDLPPLPILPCLSPPGPPQLPHLGMSSLHLPRLLFCLDHHAYKKLTASKLFRQLYSGPRIWILRPQLPDFRNFLVGEMVLFLIGCADGCGECGCGSRGQVRGCV
jgi:hypothetical protein